MKSCCCSLAGTKACIACTNNIDFEYGNTFFITSEIPSEITRYPFKITEKFNEEGKLIERITEK
jgi:hypothetical protein